MMQTRNQTIPELLSNMDSAGTGIESPQFCPICDSEYVYWDQSHQRLSCFICELHELFWTSLYNLKRVFSRNGQ